MEGGQATVERRDHNGLSAEPGACVRNAVAFDRRVEQPIPATYDYPLASLIREAGTRTQMPIRTIGNLTGNVVDTRELQSSLQREARYLKGRSHIRIKIREHVVPILDRCLELIAQS